MALKGYIAFYEPPQNQQVPLPGIIAAMGSFLTLIDGRCFAFDFDGDVDDAFQHLAKEMEPGSGLVVMAGGATQYKGASSKLIGAAMHMSDAGDLGGPILKKAG